jgi:hypothetical protein
MSISEKLQESTTLAYPSIFHPHPQATAPSLGLSPRATLPGVRPKPALPACPCPARPRRGSLGGQRRCRSYCWRPEGPLGRRHPRSPPRPASQLARAAIPGQAAVLGQATPIRARAAAYPHWSSSQLPAPPRPGRCRSSPPVVLAQQQPMREVLHFVVKENSTGIEEMYRQTSVKSASRIWIPKQHKLARFYLESRFSKSIQNLRFSKIKI